MKKIFLYSIFVLMGASVAQAQVYRYDDINVNFKESSAFENGRGLANMGDDDYTLYGLGKHQSVTATKMTITKDMAIENWGAKYYYTFTVAQAMKVNIYIKHCVAWANYAKHSNQLNNRRNQYVISGNEGLDWVGRYYASMVLALDGANLKTAQRTRPLIPRNGTANRTTFQNTQVSTLVNGQPNDTLWLWPRAAASSDTTPYYNTTPDYANVSLSAGTHTLTVTSLCGGWDFDCIEIEDVNMIKHWVGERLKINGTTYQITSMTSENDMKVGILDTDLTGEVTFPSTITDSHGHVLSVTSVMPYGTLDNGVFPTSRTRITSITLPEGLLRLEDQCFRDMTALKKVTIPKTLNYFDKSFYGCTSLEYILPYGTGTPYSMTVKNGVLFSKDEKTLHWFPSAHSTQMFQYIDPTTWYSVPSTVTRIADYAFSCNNNLVRIEVPAATTSISKTAFLNSTKLTNLNVNSSNTRYASADGMLLSKDKKTLEIFPPGKGEPYYTILPPSLTAIGDSAFYGNTLLKTVLLPVEAKTIGKYAFAECPNLSRVNILDYDVIDYWTGRPVVAVGENAFAVTRSGSLVNRLNEIDVIIKIQNWTNKYTSDATWKQAKSIQESFTVDYHEYMPLQAGPNQWDAVLVQPNSPTGTFKIPETVTYGGKTYTVRVINDRAFEMASNLSEVVIPASVEYIGSKAFVPYFTSYAPAQNIFFLNKNPENTMFARSRFGLDTGFAEMDASTKLYVRKSALSKYQSAFGYYYGTTRFEYQIPLPLSGKFSTFAREFDTDFSESNASVTKEGQPNVIAFTAGELRQGSNGSQYLVMRSINENAAQGDGTYIPANTGVLLAATDGEGSAENFYYQIYDSELPIYTGENLMRGITGRATYVQPTEGDYTNFLLSNGEFLKMTVQRQFPAHKAYLQLPTSAVTAGAKLMMVFGDEDVVTGISLDEGSGTQDESPVYDLQGRKVTIPRKGIYVQNGKKIVIK